jgi:hypothetical protein
MVAHTSDVLELTHGELCVLRWLRISNGHAILSAHAVAGNGLFVVPDRLLKAGYSKTVHYFLTDSGRKAVDFNETHAFFAGLAKRRGPRGVNRTL